MGKGKGKQKESPQKKPSGLTQQSKNKQNKKAITIEVNFSDFIFKNKKNAQLVFISLLANILLFALFKYCFPMGDLYSDSHSYIVAAAKDLKIYYRPIGYSNFLSFLHNFSSTVTFIVWVQYLLLITSGLFCFFSVDYLFRFSNHKIKLLSWFLISFNPILLVIANQVASDSLFAALTVIWFSLMLWVFKKGKWWALILQLLILYWAFTVRYNALYYPLVALFIFIFSRKRKFAYSAIGVVATLMVIGLTYSHLKKTTQRVTNTPVFAGFTGWQMANNALVVYTHLDSVSTEEFVDPKLKRLNHYVQVYIDSISPDVLSQIKAGKLPGGSFLWDTKSPLKQYLYGYSQHYRVPYFKAWYQVSEIYNRFGEQIIFDHPGTYFRYYLLPNLGLYFYPHREFLKEYNYSKEDIPKTTMDWLIIKDKHLYARYPKIQKSIISVYPAIHALLTCFGLLIPVFFLFRRKKEMGHWQKDFTLPVLFWYVFFLANMGFGILASAITLRYEVVWFILDFGLPLWFLDQIVTQRKKTV